MENNIDNTEVTMQEGRPIEVITNEILFYKQVGGNAIVEIGKRLIEAKAMLEHGQWLSWLSDNVELSEVAAQRCMRLAKEYSNPSALTDLGVTKALNLLALPESEREDFIVKKHDVNGEEKTVSEMTTRELQQAIAKLKAQDQEIVDLNDNIDKLVADINKRDDDIEDLKAQIKELESKEPEVRTVVDLDEQEKLKKQIAKLEAEKSKVEEAKKKAEAAKRTAEDQLAAVKASSAEGDKHRDENIKILEKQNEDLRKQLSIASSSEISIFKIHFEQAQQSINDMLGCIGRMRSSGDDESADKTANAYRSLLESSIAAL